MVFSIKSIIFDGIDDYIDLGDETKFQKDYTNSFSMSCWAKTRAISAVNTLLGKMTSATGQQGYLMFLNASGQFEAVLRNTETTNSLRVRTDVSRMNDGGWHHFMMTYSQTNGIRLYIDGIIKPTTTVYNNLSSTILVSKSLQIGAYDGATNPFQGSIDGVAFFNDELSASEVLEAFSSAAPSSLSGKRALDGWWKLGDGDSYPTITDQVATVATYPTIPDSTGGGANGTMTNMSASNIQLPAPRSAFSKYSLKFDGSNEYLTFGDVLNFERTSPFSWSAWIKTSYTGASQSIVSKYGQVTASPGVDLWVRLSGSLGTLFDSNYDGGNYFFASSDGGPFTAVNDGNWHHVVMAYDGSSAAIGVTFYVDGVAQTTSINFDNLTGSILTTDPFMVGRRSQTVQPQYFNGNISDVAVYDAELDQADVNWIYNSGTPRDLRLPAAPANLLAYWRLGDGAEIVQSSWIHKIQQWRFDPLATKESTTISDAGPFNSPGTLYNMDASNVTTDTPGGISNYSCSFNGVDEGMYCNVSSDQYGVYAFQTTGTPSFSGWIKTTATSGYMWGNALDRVDYSGAFMYLDGGRPVVFTGAGGTSALRGRCNNTINDGNWHHIAGTAYFTSGTGPSAGHVRIWVDGVEQTVSIIQNNSANSTSGRGYSIGARSALLYDPIEAKIDEVAIWRAPFCHQSQIDELYNGGSPCDLRDLSTVRTLVGWWRMGDAYELSGTSVNMEAEDKQADVPGPANYTTRSMWFDGLNDYISVGDGSSFDFEYTDAFSISAWIHPYGINGYRGIFWKDPYPGYGITHYGGAVGDTYFGDIRVYMRGNPTGTFSAYLGSRHNSAPYGTYFHFVMTYDGSSSAAGIKMYVDGIEWPVYIYGNTAMSGTMRNSSVPRIGLDASYWKGWQDETSVWNKELTQADVAEIYNNGDPNDLLQHSSAANLVGWWRMGEGPGNNGVMTNMVSADIVTNAPKSPGLIGQSINYYTMRGLVSTNPAVYQHWTVSGSPDFDGTYAEPVYIPPPTTYSPLTTSIRFNNDTVDERADFGSAVYPLNQTTPVSMGAWFKTSSGSSQYVILRSQAASGNIKGRGLVIIPPTGIWEYECDNFGNSGYQKVLLPSGTINDGAWHFIAFTWSGSGLIHFYFDGIEVTNGWSSGGPIPIASFRPGNSMDALWVSGCYNYLSTFAGGFLGNICHSFIYDKLLSAAEITEIYNGGTPADLSSVGPTGNLQHWCALGDGDAIGAGNLHDLSSGGNDGTFVNGESGDFEQEVPYDPNSEITSFSDITVVGSWTKTE